MKQSNFNKVLLTRPLLLLLISLLLGACSTSQAPMIPESSSSTPPIKIQVALPHPDHVVIVMEENHGYSQIIGSSNASYINTLATQGALFANSHAITHPSEPNYLALFSGSTQGINSDACPNTFSSPNLASELNKAGYSFTGYSESLPTTGYTGCYYPESTELYARKHNPWVNFTNVPTSSNRPFTDFPTDYSKLPTVSFVIPNQVDDMHSASVIQADNWLKTHLDSYARWAKIHNSLLIVTWDEDNDTNINQIPTIFVGSMVKSGHYSENINHYNVLRTLEDMYHLPYANESANATPISDMWR